jgi:hypothetical protein
MEASKKHMQVEYLEVFSEYFYDRYQHAMMNQQESEDPTVMDMYLNESFIFMKNVLGVQLFNQVIQKVNGEETKESQISKSEENKSF